ncbi:MAG TPA: hypothetical protein VNN79_10145, partial [Actinomycetota bacterium]|nr:hypothetical protein [Actinomycetota bacterium]
PFTTSAAAWPAIVFAPNEAGKAAADVVKGYLGNVPEVKAGPGQLEGSAVAVIVNSAYAGNPVAPAPSGGGSGSTSC